MANAAARWSFCGSSTFFVCIVFTLCLFPGVASLAPGPSVVLEKRAAPRRQLLVRASTEVSTVFQTETMKTFTTATTFFSSGPTGSPTASSGGSAPISSSPSSSPSSVATSSAHTLTSAGIRSNSIAPSSSSQPTPFRLSDQRPSGSAESVVSSSDSAPPTPKLPSATPSSSISPSQPSAPASVNTPALIPATTLSPQVPTRGLISSPSPVVQPVPYETTAVLTPTSSPVVAAAARSSGFWDKRGAVAAVFAIVSLVAAGALIVAAIVLRRRYRARKLREDHADLWEKFSDNSHHTRSNSPGPSINAAPLDAFAVRDESYIPASGNRQPHLSTGFYSSPIQHPDYYPDYPPAVSQQSSATQSHLAQSAALQEPVGRTSYQQSIDSFYGAAGRAL